MLKSRIKKIIHSLIDGRYHIGFVNNDNINKDDKWYKDVNWINTNGFEKDGWFADPFFYEVNENYVILLAEQFYYPINRGRLVKLIINRGNYILEEVHPILTLETHLSFPNIWREDNKVYVYPENYQGKALCIWEFNGDKMCNPKTLIEEPLIDAQVTKIKNEYFIFGVKYVSGSWSDTKELQIWKSESLFGPYLHIQTIHNDYNYERGAGEIIMTNNTILRPAQNCEGGYGKETILFKMIYDGKKFLEEEVCRISPLKGCKYNKVLHTFNQFDNLCVIDGFTYKYPLIYNLLKRTIYRNKQI